MNHIITGEMGQLAGSGGNKPPESWSRIQDSLALMTGLSLRLLSASQPGGLIWTDPVVLPSRENPICRLLTPRSPERGGCHQYCGKSPHQALRQKAALHYKCHAHLLSFAVPVSQVSGEEAVILGGHAFTSPADYSRFLDEAPQLGLTREEILEVSQRVGIVDSKALRSTAQFLDQAVGEILRCATLHQRTKTWLSQVNTLYEISGELSFHQEPYECYALILNALGVIFDVNTASVMLLDRRDGRFRTQMTFGEHEREVAGFTSLPHEGLAARVLAERRPVQIREVFDLLRLGLPDRTVTSVWAFPLLYGQTLLGIVNVFNTDLEPEEVRLLAGFCHQVSQAVENATIRQQVSRMTQEQTILMEINRVVAGTLDPDELCQVILEKSTELLMAEKGSLMLYDEGLEGLSVKAAKGLHERIISRFRIRPGEGIAGEVFRSGEPLVVKDIENNSRLQQKNRPRYRTKSFMSLPLRVGDRVIGVLNVSDKITGEVFYETDLHLLTSFALYATVALERTRLSERSKELLQISITDPLTELLNRRYFEERLTEEIDRSRRHGHAVSLLMIDIDDFKPYNDTHGHLAGDEALRITGGCIRAVVRNIDVVSRFGGDEFAVILPATQKEDARIIAERLRQEVERAFVPHEETQPSGRLTVSVGLASFPADASSMRDLISNADRSLYAAKAAGKNCIKLYE